MGLPFINNQNRISRWLEEKRWRAPGLIVLAGSINTVPLALFGFLRGDLIHLAWGKHFSDQLWSGSLYPQWLIDMNSGLGSPTFYFYGPISYYMTSFFYLVLPYYRYGWLQIGLSAALASVGSGLAAYLWLRQGFPRYIACITAIFYVWLPYHFWIDHLERFAFAEYWSFVWMPLTLYFVTRLVRGHLRSIVGLAFTYALVMMTHPPTALLFGCLPWLYALFLSSAEKKKRPLAYVAAGMVLGTLMAAAYLIPAVTTQSDASVREMTVADGSYENNFLYVTLPGAPGPMQEFFQGWLQKMTRMTLIVGCMAALLAFAGLSGAKRTERILWSIVAVFALAMMHPFSSPLWKAIPLLQKIQFPWRFHILLTLALTAMFAHAIEANSSIPLQPWRTVAFYLAMLLFGVEGLYTLRAWRFALEQKPVVPARWVFRDEPEYRPRWVPPETYTIERVKQLGDETPLVQAISGEGQAHVEKWSGRRIQIDSNGTTELQLKVRQFYFPTWTATLENGAPCPTSPSATDGLLLVSVPPGQRHITLKIKPHGPALFGKYVSIAATILTLSLLLILSPAMSEPR